MAPTRGIITLDWQRMYRPEDFHTWSDLWHFLQNLQTAISPIWSTLEISFQLIFGSTWFLSKILYPLLVVLNYLLALRLFGTSRSRILSITFASLVFLTATRILHKGNPQMYDIYVPLLILLFVACLQHIRTHGKIAFAFYAGLALTTLELTRSYIFPLLPILVGLALLSMARLPRRAWLLFFLPILLFSGTWHLKQLICHNQLHWSNHSGYNLSKVWSDYTTPITFQESPPLYQGGFDNLNTDLHTQNNKVLSSSVMKGIAQRPFSAIARTATRLVTFYEPRTDLYLAEMKTLPRLIYQPTVWLTALLMVTGLILTLARTLSSPRNSTSWLLWGKPEAILAFSILAISLLCAIGESGEEARFMVTLLPLLATLPGYSLIPQKEREH